MRSFVVATSEVDDIEIAVQDLLLPIRERFTLEAHSVAIAYCDADMDVAAFSELLRRELQMDVIGVTTTATVERHSGYSGGGVLLSVLTASDVFFSTVDTGEVDRECVVGAIETSYQRARQRLDQDPKLVVTFLPYNPNITSERYLDILNRVAEGVPIFGGVAADYFDFQNQKTFLNGRELSTGLVMLLISGNIRPLFALQHHLGGVVQKKGLITKSDENVVSCVGDQTFKEFISSMVPLPSDDTVVYDFQSTPLVMEHPDFVEGEQPVVRALYSIDHECGAGGFHGEMPVGSSIYLTLFTHENVALSCEASLKSALAQLSEQSDYNYSMMFVCTCNGRYLMIGSQKALEGDLTTASLQGYSEALNVAGFYSFGELCPTGYKSDGQAKNRFHNLSYAVCVI